MIASTKGNEEFIEMLLSNPHIKVEPKNTNGVNAFWLAASCGHGRIMRSLAEAGSDIFAIHEKKGYNALHIAAKKNYHNVVKMLL